MTEEVMKQKYLELGITEEVYNYGTEIEKTLKERFAKIDEIAEYNQLKVINAMQKCRVSAECFQSTSGYGYNDIGRDTLEEVYAECFHGEAALVRPQITCGTHALALALMSNLRPGDELLSPVGKPYDTLEEVIGIRPSKGSLAGVGSGAFVTSEILIQLRIGSSPAAFFTVRVTTASSGSSIVPTA